MLRILLGLIYVSPLTLRSTRARWHPKKPVVKAPSVLMIQSGAHTSLITCYSSRSDGHWLSSVHASSHEFPFRTCSTAQAIITFFSPILTRLYSHAQPSALTSTYSHIPPLSPPLLFPSSPRAPYPLAEMLLCSLIRHCYESSERKPHYKFNHLGDLDACHPHSWC